MTKVRRAEIMAVARTQTNDTRCFNTRDGHGQRAKRQGAKRLRQYLKAKDASVGVPRTCVNPGEID